MKVNILKLNHPHYPAPLKQLADRPDQLYWLGSHPGSWLKQPKVAIVGSRKATAYGLGVAAQLASELAAKGVVIISGLAFGIDAAAHRGALQAAGRTVAVLPTPLNNIYPASHRSLSQQILSSGGSLISEYRAGTASFKTNFIARNRLVSGLADVVVIPEAAVNSGSLHTARFGLEQGKTVMAVPGNVTNPNSEGSNNLIKSGALPVTNSEDVLLALGFKSVTGRQPKQFQGSPQARQVLELITSGITAQEELALISHLDGPAVASSLTMLEIGGYIKAQGAGHWIAI